MEVALKGDRLLVTGISAAALEEVMMDLYERERVSEWSVRTDDEGVWLTLGSGDNPLNVATTLRLEN